MHWCLLPHATPVPVRSLSSLARLNVSYFLPDAIISEIEINKNGKQAK